MKKHVTGTNCCENSTGKREPDKGVPVRAFKDIVDQDYRDEPYWWRHARPFDTGNAELPGKIDVVIQRQWLTLPG